MEKGKEIYQTLLRKYGVTDRKTLTEKIAADLNIDGKAKKDMLNRLEKFGQLLECDYYEGEDGVRHISKQQTIQEEKAKKSVSRDKKLVEIACGGRSFASTDGYKYWGACSNSYTIPQLAGLYALSRQVSQNLTFDQFSKLAKQTAMQIEDRLVISPERLIEQVKQLEESQNITMFHEPKSERVSQTTENILHKIDNSDIIGVKCLEKEITIESIKNIANSDEVMLNIDENETSIVNKLNEEQKKEFV